MDTNTVSLLTELVPKQVLPTSLVAWLTALAAAAPLLGKLYKSMSDGNGLVGGVRAFLFGSAHTVPRHRDTCPKCGQTFQSGGATAVVPAPTQAPATDPSGPRPGSEP